MHAAPTTADVGARRAPAVTVNAPAVPPTTTCAIAVAVGTLLPPLTRLRGTPGYPRRRFAQVELPHLVGTVPVRPGRVDAVPRDLARRHWPFDGRMPPPPLCVVRVDETKHREIVWQRHIAIVDCVEIVEPDARVVVDRSRQARYKVPQARISAR